MRFRPPAPRAIWCADLRLRRSRNGRLSGARRGRAFTAAFPLALARQVVPADPAHLDPPFPLARVPAPDERPLFRAPLHRPLPARDLRLQPRRAALDVARRVLQLQRARDRPLPAVLARRGARLPGAARDRLPGVAAEGVPADRLVAAR